jgi:DNA-binding IscR family transcriptional regulator
MEVFMDLNEKNLIETMIKAGKPMKSGEIAKSTGLDNKEVAKILSSLKKQGIVHSPKACFYAPVAK